jgi:septal ring factor EnvC (AmiA/AmiB activator)
MDGHRRSDEGSAQIVRAIPPVHLYGWMGGALLAAGGLFVQLNGLEKAVERMDIRQEQAIQEVRRQVTEANKQNSDLQSRLAKVEGQLDALMARRTATQ